MTLRNEPHEGYEGEAGGPAVIVRFKSSSQPKGQDGYEVAITSGATQADVFAAILLAAEAREQMQAILEGRTSAQLREHAALAAERTALQQAEDIAAASDPSWYRRAMADVHPTPVENGYPVEQRA